MTTLDLSIPPWLSGAGATSSSAPDSSLPPVRIPETPEEHAKLTRERVKLDQERKESMFNAMFIPFVEALAGGANPYEYFGDDRRIYEFFNIDDMIEAGMSENAIRKKVLESFVGKYISWIRRDAWRTEQYLEALKNMSEVYQFKMANLANDEDASLLDVEQLNFKFKVFTKFMAYNNERFQDTKKLEVTNTVDIRSSIALGRERVMNRPELKLVQGVTIENGGE